MSAGGSLPTRVSAPDRTAPAGRRPPDPRRGRPPRAGSRGHPRRRLGDRADHRGEPLAARRARPGVRPMRRSPRTTAPRARRRGSASTISSTPAASNRRQLTRRSRVAGGTLVKQNIAKVNWGCQVLGHVQQVQRAGLRAGCYVRRATGTVQQVQRAVLRAGCYVRRATGTVQQVQRAVLRAGCYVRRAGATCYVLRASEPGLPARQHEHVAPGTSHGARRTWHVARCTLHVARCTLHVTPCRGARGHLTPVNRDV